MQRRVARPEVLRRAWVWSRALGHALRSTSGRATQPGSLGARPRPSEYLRACHTAGESGASGHAFRSTSGRATQLVAWFARSRFDLIHSVHSTRDKTGPVAE